MRLQNPAREASCPLRGHCAVAGAVPPRRFGLFACRPLRRDSSGYSLVARADFPPKYTLRADTSTASALSQCFRTNKKIRVPQKLQSDIRIFLRVQWYFQGY